MPARPRCRLPSAPVVRLEPLEGRITPAVYYVDNPADYVITTDQGAAGLDNGDTVTFNPSGGTQTPVAGLAFGIDAFGTLQAAVTAAAPGDTINVAEGTFAEQVSYNKQLFVRGNQFGADARAGRTGLPATETVLDDTANSGRTPVNVTASGVVIDGFTIQGVTSVNQFGFGILLAAGTSGSQVLNNIIQNNIAGISLANASAATPTVISQNLIRDNNQPGPASGSGIYTDQFNAGGALTTVSIADNAFVNNVSPDGFSGSAINFSSTMTGSQSAVTIQRNTFDDNGRALVAFNLVDSSFTQNEVRNSLYVNSADLRLFEGVSNLTISNNIFSNDGVRNIRGVRVSNIGTGAPNATGIVFEDNSITGYDGTTFEGATEDDSAVDLDAGQYTGPFNAAGNFWGSPTGPTNPNNPGGTGEEIDDPDGNVAFAPFLTDGTDDDPGTPGFQPVPTVSIGDVTMVEGNGPGTTAFTFTVSLSAASAQTLTVDFATQDGTATVADLDYVANAGTLTFAPGVTSQPITVLVTGDTKFEVTETFFVNLSNATGGATFTDAQGLGTVTNDDPIPTVSIGDATAAEGTAGTTQFVFTVTLTNPSSEAITVPYTTNDGTATVADLDYVANTGTLTFAPGVTTQAITVLVNGDTKFEADETFSVTLNPSVGVLAGDTSGLGTITNDDLVPTVSVGDATAAEGGQVVFTFTLSNPSSQTVSVRVNTTGDTATANEDYNNIDTFFDVVFLSGETSRTLNVPTFQDNIDEPGETFFLNILFVTNVTVADGQGVGTITDDDPTPTVSIFDATDTEGDAAAKTITLAMSLSGPSSQTITVDFSTNDGTATLADNDYVFTSGTVTFAPGQTAQTVTVQVNGDTQTEPNETVTVTLTGVSPGGGAVLGDTTGTITIFNDDAPLVTVGDATAAEGDGAVFTVTLSGPTTQTVTVRVNTAGDTATANVDYNNIDTFFDVVFTPGQTTQTVGVPTFQDNIDEPDETFVMNVLAVTNAIVADGQGVGTIIDDDAPTADLRVTKTDAPDPVTAGQTLTYTFIVSTTGPDAASTVEFSDVLPAGTTFASFTAPAGWAATTPAVGSAGTVTATLASLPAGSLPQVFTLVVNVTPNVAAGTVVTNTATIASAATDPTPGDNTAAATTTVVTSAGLAVATTDSPDPVRMDGLLTYTITLTNAGPSAAAGVTLTDAIPADTSFVSFTAPAGWTSTTPPVGGSGIVTSTRATVGPGAAPVFTLVVRVNPNIPTGTVISNTATASSATTDPTPGDNAATETTRVGGAVLPVVVGDGSGSSRVRVFDPATGSEVRSFFAFPGFGGAVRVAAGDVTGDGVADIITGAGPGGAAHVKVFDGATGAEVRSFFAYAPSFLGGVFVGAGDVDGDGFVDIVTGAGAGAGPHVKVFSGRTGAEIQSFFAYAPTFLGGVTVAAADVDGDGRADVITGASDGGSSHVKVFSAGVERASFFAFDSAIRGGVFVAAGDLDGDGRAEVIAGNGRTAAEVKVFSFDGGGTAKVALLAQNPELARSGARVAVADRGGDGQLDVVVGAGLGTAPVVQVFDGRTLARVDEFLAYEAGALGGVFVG